MGKIYPTAVISDRTKLKMGKDSFIGDFVFISVPKLEIGEGSQINAGCRIIGNQPCIIGKHVVISYDVLILTSTDSVAVRMNDYSPRAERKVVEGQVSFGDYSYVGAKSILSPGVILGQGAVVGAFSFLPKCKMIQPWTVGWGQPWRRRGVRPRQI